MKVSCDGVMTSDELNIDVKNAEAVRTPELNLKPILRAARQLNRCMSVADVTSIFHELACDTGYRMLLMRKWSSGLRVLLAVGIDIPAEMTTNGYNPELISLIEEDIFSLTSEEKSVYVGNLTSKIVSGEFMKIADIGNQQSFILPLPSRGRWNTSIYFDWDVDCKVASLLPLLANSALTKLHCIEAEIITSGSKISAIMAAEKAHRTDLSNIELSTLTPEKVVNMVGELSVLPQVASRVLSLLSKDDATAADLEREISLDQVMTARILGVANSSYFMGNSEIKTVRDAIVRLGFRTIRSWTLVAASRAVILGGRKSEVLNSIWEKSVSTAIACQVAADTSGLCNREVAFTGGLMQNLGQLVLARALPDQYKKIFESANKQGEPVHAIEKATFGFDHGDLGGCLIDRWHLNPELAGAVKLHHAGYEEEVPELARLIALGEELAEVRENTLEVVEVKHAISKNAKILNIDVDTWTKMWEELSIIDVEC